MKMISQEITMTACQTEDDLCEEQQDCDSLTVLANQISLTLQQRKENRNYGVSLVLRYHDNSTQTVYEDCIRTKV